MVSEIINQLDIADGLKELLTRNAFTLNYSDRDIRFGINDISLRLYTMDKENH
jgi:hypothetical protein